MSQPAPPSAATGPAPSPTSRLDVAVEAIHLVKKFDDFTAVDDISFVVPTGSVLGLLGPNGAGKTTTVRMMTTLSVPTSGTARIAGFDVRENPEQVRRNMGLTGQAATVDEILTGRENLRMVGGLYGITRKALAARTDELLDQFSLSDAADKQVRAYSGGMRRRLDLAVSLLAAPPVLFLDEPTTGLDPRSRAELWDVLRRLVAGGTTLVLTTQYLEEADQLADNIVVIDKGRIIAEGTPLQLKERAGAASVVITVSDATSLPAASKLLRRNGGEVFVDETARTLTSAASGLADLTRIAGWFDESGITVDDIGLARPSLDDVFLSLTGHRAEGAQNDRAEGAQNDRAEGAQNDRAEGAQNDRAEGAQNDRAEGAQNDRAEGAQNDRAEGAQNDRAEGAQNDRAEGAQNDRAEGAQNDRAEGAQNDRAEGAQDDRAEGAADTETSDGTEPTSTDTSSGDLR